MPTAFKKPFFIYNPVAGTSDPETTRRVFKEACGRFEWDPEIHETSAGEDLEQVVHGGLDRGCDVVIVGGGDGTVSAVASALVYSSTPLAIVPLGTGNILAKQIRLPLALEDAFDYLAKSPEILRMDAMRIGERCYVLNVSMGVSSRVMKSTSRADKRQFGFLAYVWQTLRAFVGLQPHRFKVVADGHTHIVRASEVFISNTSFLGENPLLRDIETKPDDGKLEVFVVRARSAPDYIDLLRDVLLGRARQTRGLSYYPVREQVEISTPYPLMVQADGDLIRPTPVTVEVVPRAVRVLVPPAPPKEAA